MRIHQSLDSLIGHTPLLSLTGYSRENRLENPLIAKLEYFNPAGSAKDRIALRMINDAESAGKLKAGTVIVEPTSGNTGIGLAAIAAARGYRVILTMPETMSAERRMLLSAYGAEIVLTPGNTGMQGAVAEAKRIAASLPSAWIPSQFDNPSNPAAHYRTTGPEIWSDTDGKIDVLVATVGTGGTLSGTARYLKEMKPEITVIAVEPASSPLLSEGHAGAHKIQGIGANFVPETLDRTIYNRVMTVRDEDAFTAARTIATRDGILLGISSGAAVSAATDYAREASIRGECPMIVAICPDTGERYLSSGLFIG